MLNFNMKAWIALAGTLLAVLVVSGCVNPESMIKIAETSPVIQSFLSDYPDAEISVRYLQKVYIESDRDFITMCQDVAASDYYKIAFSDQSSGLKAFAFVDAERGVICAFKEGGEPEECTEDWSCTKWSPDICPPSGIKTRACTDLNECETGKSKPEEIMECTYVPPENCTPHSEYMCYGNALYWYDSCGKREEIKEECPFGCLNTSCQNCVVSGIIVITQADFYPSSDKLYVYLDNMGQYDSNYTVMVEGKISMAEKIGIPSNASGVVVFDIHNISLIDNITAVSVECPGLSAVTIYIRTIGEEGYDGLEIASFLPDFSDVYSCDEVRLHLNIKNIGDGDVTNIRASLSGIYQPEWGFEETKTIGDLLYNPTAPGAVGSVYWNMTAPSLAENVTYTFQPRAVVSYDYKGSSYQINALTNITVTGTGGSCE